MIDQNEDDRVLRALGDRTLPIRRHRCVQRSLSYAKNQGIREARGEWITFADDDCWLPPEALKRIFERLELLDQVEGGRPDFVGFGRIISEHGTEFSSYPEESFEITRVNDSRIFLAPAISQVFSKTAIQKIGFFDERLSIGATFGSAEDTDFLARAVALGIPVRFLPDWIWHHPVIATHEISVPKLYAYGLGFGAFCRKHRLWAHIGFKIFKQLGGAVFFVALGRFKPAARALAIARGRTRGFYAYRPLRSVLGTLKRRWGRLPSGSTSGLESGRAPEPRVYFGTPRAVSGSGGPWSRNQRMIEAFGNTLAGTSIVYANSAEILPLEWVTRARTQTQLKIVLNQNGMHYPAWYRAPDLQQKNDRMRRLYELADEVIFQSAFAREAFSYWAGVPNPKGQVIHNSAPDLPRLDSLRREDLAPDRPVIALSAIFHASADHFLLPTLESFLEHLPKDFVLRLIGPMTQAALASPWYPKAQAMIQTLTDAGRLERIPSYTQAQLPATFANVAIALHLHDLDCCPNAVIERMAMGLPHIYLNSGGTPELVGTAGVAIDPIAHPLYSAWEHYRSVDPSTLAQVIQSTLAQAKTLGDLARKRYDSDLSWTSYLQKHRELFQKVHRT